jgi:lipid A 4'-phosphatase
VTPRTALRIGIALAVLLVILPLIDLSISSWFYNGQDFVWQRSSWAGFVQKAIRTATIVIAVGTIALAVWATIAHRALLGLDARRWLFLFLALAIGPGLVANTILKDHWGRPRPREVVEFGGSLPFSPPLVIAAQCERNCSFVAGDPTIGWYASSFAYVAPVRRRRPVFWGGIGLGVLIGLLRIGMGGHFFSDVLFGAAAVLGVIAALHMLMFGRRETALAWRHFTRGLIRWPP